MARWTRRLRARIKAVFSVFKDADPRVVIAFWLFGLINNVLYVIILSAALDLVGPTLPKGIVLLFDVVPSFLAKLCAPYFIHIVPYPVRILIFVALSTSGMLLIALTPSYVTGDGSVATKMAGVVLASLSSGFGELSFLGLTHFYGTFSLAAWGSGTGGAGLLGAGAYAIATNVLRLKVKTALLASAFLPVIMLISFFTVLPRAPLLIARKGSRETLRSQISRASFRSTPAQGPEEGRVVTGSEGISGGEVSDVPVSEESEQDDLLGRVVSRKRSYRKKDHLAPKSRMEPFRANLRLARGLFFPFMLPLLLVYIAEYTINQGVSPTLLFPLPETPFRHYRAFYPTYNAIYQSGVFISRSSTPFFRIHNLYLPSFLQIVNLLILTLHAIYDFLPNVYLVFVIIFWEGLLGGLVYVNTFAEILDTVPKENREFSLGATTVSDSGGICIAGFLGMALEVALCGHQVRHGRNHCQQL
ncbi:battenin CLN3 protein [Agyrium rufum]|nr:battenin CLN3 protein [Agyrium rufum]